MKKLRKLLSVAAAALVAASLAVTTTVSSFADEEPTYSITINNTNENHTYEAYQIFTGTLDVVDGAKILSDIQWGEGVDEDALLEALAEKYPGVFDEEMSAADVAKAITANKDNIKDIAQVIGDNLSEKYTASAKASGTTAVISGLAAGYYLVKDKDDSLNGKDDAYTGFIIEVVGDAEADVKSDKPKVEKKVQDDDDSVTEAWQDVADYDIGDDVPFQLTATLPSNIGDYKSYKLVFHDTMSVGLTYKAVSKITVGGVDVTSQLTSGIDGSNQSLTVTIEDLKKLTGVTIEAGTKVIVYYTATLNANAKIGNAVGNPNEAYLEYSNNPNVGGEGDTGTTTKDKVVVFTYELDITKVDGEQNTTKLKDAEFKLKNAEGKWLVVDESGKVKEWVENEENASTLKTGTDGLIKVIGLDEGTYTLKETKAPTGYNLLKDPITLEIEAGDIHDTDYDGSNAAALCPTITIDVDESDEPENGDAATGKVSTTVENYKGSSLPSTGGIGTTIFFVGGGIVVAVAAILLIVKRRMREVA